MEATASTLMEETQVSSAPVDAYDEVPYPSHPSHRRIPITWRPSRRLTVLHERVLSPGKEAAPKDDVDHLHRPSAGESHETTAQEGGTGPTIDPKTHDSKAPSSGLLSNQPDRLNDPHLLSRQISQQGDRVRASGEFLPMTTFAYRSSTVGAAMDHDANDASRETRREGELSKARSHAAEPQGSTEADATAGDATQSITKPKYRSEAERLTSLRAWLKARRGKKVDADLPVAPSDSDVADPQVRADRRHTRRG